MTTVIPFVPSNIMAPSIPATLDGDDTTIQITWNVSAQRFYINIYASDGTWVTTVPLIRTPPSIAVESAYFDPLQSAVIVSLEDPLLWPIQIAPGVTKPGTIVQYTMEQFLPTTYNGLFNCIQVDNQTVRYSQPQDPGFMVRPGFVSRYLNMVAGVYQTSTLIYRNDAFEVNP